ncbi:ribonuclease H-like domain-containing protein, partial [Mycena epipterygia]
MSDTIGQLPAKHTLQRPSPRRSTNSHTPRTPAKIDLPTTTEIDRLFIQVLNSKLTCEQKLEKLFGGVTATSNPVEVYVDGSCLNNGRDNAAAGAGVYWGPNHPWNEGVRVPDNQTNNRGEVYAILRALQRAYLDQTLHIWSDSEYAMESIAVRAPDEASRGWKCTNGDLFRDIVSLIKQRHAPVVFIQVKGHSGNTHNDAADALAKLGAT